MSEKIESRNKALVLEAFDTLFNKRDDAASELLLVAGLSRLPARRSYRTRA